MADLHVGRVRTSNVSFPLGERDDLLDRLDTLLGVFSPELVVIAGDLLHSFTRVPPTVSQTVEAITTCIDDHDASLVVTPGNHDVLLDAIFDGLRSDEWVLDGTLVCHGHEEPTTSATRYILGHEHPAIRIEGRKLPCYLYGSGVFQGSDVFVLPPFGRLARGTTINRHRTVDCLSPFLRNAGLGAFRPIVRDEEKNETFIFPQLRSFRSLL